MTRHFKDAWPWPQRLVLPVVLMCAMAGSASADPLDFSGDGSGTDNPDLLRTGSVCGAPCGSGPIDLYGPPPVVDQGDRLVPAAELEPQLLDGNVQGRNGLPYESDAYWFETDWSIRLRGSYIESTSGVDALARVEPTFSLIHNSRGGQFTLDSSAELSMDRTDTPRFGAVNLAASQTLALDAASNLRLSGDLSLSQQSANDPGVADDVAAMPLELEGSAALGVDRQFGQLQLDASADLSRKLMTDTLLDGGPQSNVDQQYWAYGGALRAGYAITPILTPFVEAETHFYRYDAAPESTGVPLNGWDSAITAGLAANWQDVLTAEASVGLGVRQFESASLSSMKSAVYALDLAYAPDETISVGANFSTALNAGDPDSGEPRSVTYAASADVNYVLNSWLTLRGSINGDYTEPEAGGLHRFNYGGGVGADVALTGNSSLTFDYGYDESRTTSEPIDRAHEFSLGVMFSK